MHNVISCSQISLQLVQSGKREPPSRLDRAKEVIQSVPECSNEDLQPVSGSDAQEEAQQTSPIHFKEKDVTTRGKLAKLTYVCKSYCSKHDISSRNFCKASSPSASTAHP